MSDTSLPSEQH